MKHLLKPARFALTLVLAVAMTCGLCLTAFAAADAPSLDLSRSGSISVTLEDEDGVTVTDGSVTIYQVAELYLDDGDMAWRYTASFSGMTVALDVEDSSLAATLADYVSENGFSGKTAQVGADGTVSFSGLDLGLYLVVQTVESDGYYTFSPFVVTVPLDEDGAWAYDVDATPKMGVLTAVPEEETTTTTTTDSTLPQTGQLRWPIPVLAVCGLALFLLGWRVKRSEGSYAG